MSPRRGEAGATALVACLDALAFSSLWLAAAAAALCIASARAMGVAPSATAVGIAACGTIAVYTVDRLRDLGRDRLTAPLRSAFVARHHDALVALCGAALAVSAWLAVRAGLRAIAVLSPALVLGLLHRRLKHFAAWKPLYVTAAWVTVVVALPAVTASGARRVGWTAAIVAATVLANAIASSVRDGETASRLGPRASMQLARALAIAGVAVALAAPTALRPLAIVPLATLAALVAFHRDERYGHVTLDGALLLGALGALPLL